MSLQNTSRHSADASIAFDDLGTLSPLVIEGCTVERTIGFPAGVFDFLPDPNTSGNWSPTECLVQLSGGILTDDIFPINLLQYRWVANGDGTYRVRVRVLTATDFGLDFADLPFCFFLERKN
ncbi:MAG: hypothetical protein E6R03_10115 [Hyphomicrobiaceae bacterium]|nr:MAG: hypothetical protein E6R03_10115 [Hyphomicrobiaceae bacterium]